jgi:hypothetical protein
LGEGGIEIVRSLPHGHVAAVLGTMRKLGLEESHGSRPCLERTLVVAMLVARLLHMAEALRAHKDLVKVERAFRCMKKIDLKVCPIFHWLADRVRAHVFLRMLSYCVEWHLQKWLAPLLFDDHHRAVGEALRASIVPPAERSPAAKAKDRHKQTAEGLPVHSLQTLLSDLGTLAKNRVRLRGTDAEFYQLTAPTDLQRRAFDLLGIIP